MIHTRRLIEIATSRMPHMFSTQERMQALLERVKVIPVHSSAELLERYRRTFISVCACASVLNWFVCYYVVFYHRLERLEELALTTHARLILLDSIAALVRSEFDQSSLQLRQQTLAKVCFYFYIRCSDSCTIFTHMCACLTSTCKY